MKAHNGLVLRFSLGLSILLMAGWVGQVEWQKQNSTVAYLRIKGFDPRDLLSGHYLRYQVDFGSAPVCAHEVSRKFSDICVCVEGGSTVESPVAGFRLTECSDDKKRQCPVMMKGICEYGAFRGGFERYYFPEDYAKDLVFAPKDAVVRAKINRSGKVIVDQMYVSGQPLSEYLYELQMKKLDQETPMPVKTP